MKRVALIGLDGMSWKVLLSYKDAFKQVLGLAAEGTAGICSSTPPYTPPSWTSISTGVRPEKHGILGFTRPSFVNEQRSRALSSFDLKFPRICEIVSLNGMKSLVVNHVLSYPPSGWYLKNHVLVSDDHSPKTFIYPSRLSRFLPYFDKESLDIRADRKDFLRLLRDYVEQQAEGVRQLDALVDPDFLWVVFTAPDTIMHKLQHVAAGSFDPLVGGVFASIDDFVGNIKRTYDYIFIVSDHGFDIYSKRINVYGLLAESGLLPRPSIKSRMFSALKSSRLSEATSLCAIRSKFMTGGALRVMRRLAFPKSPSTGAENLRGVSIMMTDDVDADDAFVLYFPNDIMRDFCLRVLSRKLGTAFECVKSVNMDESLKALIVVPAQEFHFDNRFALRSRSLCRFAEALHSRAGMYLIHGPGICRELRTIENIDVAPTLVSMLGVPSPLHYEGHSLLDSSQDSAFKGYLDKWRVARRAYWLGRQHHKGLD